MSIVVLRALLVAAQAADLAQSSALTGRAKEGKHVNGMAFTPPTGGQDTPRSWWRFDGPAKGAAECRAASDCSLNGDCVAGHCSCDAPWQGTHCDLLSTLPADPQRGYHNESAASWGGNVVHDRAGGRFHLFVAQMARGCGLEHWGTNSMIIRAEAATAEGPFAYAETVVAPFAHNPTIRTLPSGGFVLFFIGGSPSVPTNCSHGQQPTAAAAAAAPVGGEIHAIYAPTVHGPWTVPHQIAFDDGVNASASVWTGGGYNPSPSIDLDGTVTLALQRAYRASPGKELLGVARANSWRGPYKMITTRPVQPERPWCVAGTGEDPFLWRDTRGMHMLYHGMCPSGFLEAHYAFSSDDGVTWTVSPRQAYSYDVPFINGSSHLFARVERPQLAFANGSGSAPTHLLNGVCQGGSPLAILRCWELPDTDGPVMTWTLVRPLGVADVKQQ